MFAERVQIPKTLARMRIVTLRAAECLREKKIYALKELSQRKIQRFDEKAPLCVLRGLPISVTCIANYVP